MSNLLDRKNRIVSFLTILLVFSLSSIAFAAPDNKHGRGPSQANYRDRDRDDDNDDGWDDRGRGEGRRRATILGMRAGFEAGRRDRVLHRSFNFRDEQAYRVATLGYRRQFGSIEMYRRNFREAFMQGYIQGFRTGGGSRWLDR